MKNEIRQKKLPIRYIFPTNNPLFISSGKSWTVYIDRIKGGVL